MGDISFRVAEASDLPVVASWMIDLCRQAERHCLHTWSGGDAATLGQQLTRHLADSELVYVLAHRDGCLVGAMGSEYDEELGRGWLHGPHAVDADWPLIPSELLARVRRSLPDSISTLDAYLNVKNTRAREFYHQQGFEERPGISHDLAITRERERERERGRSIEPCVMLGDEHHASFLELFAELFPNTYYSGTRLIRMIGTSHRVFVIAAGERVLGFSVTSVDEGRVEGEVQFIGVRPECRRSGLGRGLLLTALDWLLDRERVAEVSLNVRGELDRARRLYESVGFQLRYSGIALRKEVSP